jgi:hypothetical protein
MEWAQQKINLDDESKSIIWIVFWREDIGQLMDTENKEGVGGSGIQNC